MNNTLVFTPQMSVAYKQAPKFQEIKNTHYILYDKIMECVVSLPTFFDHIILNLKTAQKTRACFHNRKLKNKDLRARIIARIHEKLNLVDCHQYLQRILLFLKPKHQFILITIKRCVFNCKDNEHTIILRNLYNSYIDTVIHTLCASCYPLVTSIAKSSFKEYDFQEKILNGHYGLLLAAYKFEFDRNTKFTTYAIHWIRTAISDGGIRDKYTLTINEADKVRLTCKNNTDTFLSQINNAKAINFSAISTYKKDSADVTSIDYGDHIPSLQIKPDYAKQMSMKKWEYQGVKLFKSVLDDIEFFIVASRFELFDHSFKTWTNLEKICNRSTFKIHRIYERAIKKIKNNNKLLDLLQDIV